MTGHIGCDGLTVGGEPPVRGKQCLQLRHRRSLDDHRQIFPEAFRPRRPNVRPGKVHAAGQGDLAVDDDQFAMVPQVCAAPEWEMDHRHEIGDFGARLDQRGQHSAPHAPGTDIVEQQAHHNAVGHATSQAGDQALAPLVTSQDIGRDVNGGACVLDQANDLQIGINP